MATITGTSGADAILRNTLSAGVMTDPLGVSGTVNGSDNLIYGHGGNDLIEASDSGDNVYGGSGKDTITGGLGFDNLYGGGGSDTINAGSNASNFLWDIVNGGKGADQMSGGTGLHFYVVDNYADKVLDTGAKASDQLADAVITNLAFYALGETSGIDFLYFNPSLFQIDLKEQASIGFGNSKDNDIYGNDCQNILHALGGDDIIDAAGGNDLIKGGAGDDALTDGGGSDVVLGQDGNDGLVGGGGKDILVGGLGNDLFEFRALDKHDVIRAGDGAVAFEGAGSAAGDLIFLPNQNESGEWIDSDLVHFGDTKKGGVTFVDKGANTLLRFNVDDDADLEFQVLIEDGKVKASQYTFDDIFI